MTCARTAYFVGLLVLLTGSPNVFAGLDSDNRDACRVIEYFYTTGCPHCAKAGLFLRQLEAEQPEITIHFYDISDRSNGTRRFIELNRRFKIERPGVPSFHLCDQFLIGFDHAGTTGRQIKAMLGLERASPEKPGSPSVAVPFFGEIDVQGYGLPLFTVLVGLVDGFNPCAMWVLLFLLTLLINLRSRSRILMVAGTFVLISGLVYFAFMAAWLNLFLVIGFSRSLQIAVAAAALAIGGIHIKDYFVLKKGITLSIPEATKPGLYARMRNVVYAENLPAGLVAVTVLAILVNFFELLCTAGLPAVYTHILTLYSLPKVQYYAYLALYNLAYIADDILMLSVVVYTLERTRLQEKAGRILKLISGTVIIALGIYLLLPSGFDA